MVDRAPDELNSVVSTRPGSSPGSSLLPWARAKWRLITTAVIALIVGYVLGSQYAWLESSDQGGFIPAEFLITVVSIAILGGAGLLGLIFLMGNRTRAGGRTLLLFAVFGAAGWPIGNALGARWQDPVAHLGEVVLELAEPVGTRLMATVTCWTQPNGDLIVHLEGEPIGDIGIDRLGVDLDISPGTATTPASGSLELPINNKRGYVGRVTLSDLTALHSTGRATFSDLRPDVFRIGGWVSSVNGSPGTAIPGVPSGLEALSGSVSWSCSTEPAPAPAPVEVPPEPVQGRFTLSGLVEAPDSCVDGRCFPYAYASGTCSKDAELRVDALETVVPWADGARARLRLVPERDSATLIVSVDDGRPLETVRSAATLVEIPSGSTTGSIGTRTLEATFPLTDGDLSLTAEWGCGDNFEE